MKRREFLKTTLRATLAPALWAETEWMWGGPPLDIHLHLRKDPDACFTHIRFTHIRFTHIQGCGVTNAVLLTAAAEEDKARPEMDRRPRIFVRSVTADPSPPDASHAFRKAISDGAVSIGELKFHLAPDSAEMRHVYDIAAETGVPVMMHIQKFPHFAGELPHNTGYDHFDKVLSAQPKTNLIGHGDLF